MAGMLVLACGAAGADGWDLLKSLAGEWESNEASGPPLRISYRVVSNGSAVIESMDTKEGQMVTVYHRDGNALMATHYCNMGNQPRMRAESASGAGGRIAFKFLDITNLKSADAIHIHGLTLMVPDKDHLIEEWTSRGEGKDEKTVFKLARKK